MDVRLIAAVGRDGQLGLGGKLPWHDPIDLKWFKETTMGGVVLMGGRTYDKVGNLPGRIKARWGGKTSPYAVLNQLTIRYRGTTIWIAGGAFTYIAFMPYVRIAVVSRIDYDGLADAYMPPLWGPLNAHGDTFTNADPADDSRAGTLSEDAAPGSDSAQDARRTLRRKRYRPKRRIE